MKIFVVCWSDGYNLLDVRGVYSSELNAFEAHPELRKKETGVYLREFKLNEGVEDYQLTSSEANIRMCLDRGTLCDMNRRLLEIAIENDWN